MAKVVKPKALAKPKRVPVKALTHGQRLDIIGEEVILERIARCEFIHVIAKDYGMAACALHGWLNARPEKYVAARERQADKLVEDMLQIADDGRNDSYLDADGNVHVDQDVIARSRLRVEARKWLAGKMNAKRYGDRLALDANVTTNIPMEQVDAQIARLTAKLNGPVGN